MYSMDDDDSSSLKFEPHADYEPEFTALYNSDCPFLVAHPENAKPSGLERPRAMLVYLQSRVSKSLVIIICLSAALLWVRVTIDYVHFTLGEALLFANRVHSLGCDHR